MAVLVKTLNGLTYSDLKNRNGLAVASISKITGLDVTGGGFLPTDIVGLIAWYATDSVSGSFSDGDPVPGLPDLSGNGYHLNQGTLGKQPLFDDPVLNGLPVLDCSAPACLGTVSSIPHGIGTADFFVSCVVKVPASSAYRCMWGNEIFNPAAYFSSNVVNLYFGTDYTFDTAQTPGDWIVVSIGRESGVIKCWINGTVETTTHSDANSIPNGDFFLASENITANASSLYSSEAELVFAKATPSADRASTEDYLGAKYGITITH